MNVLIIFYFLCNTGDFKFVSATYRLFKVPRGDTKPRQVIYNGSITGVTDSFQFDSQNTFKVCSSCSIRTATVVMVSCTSTDVKCGCNSQANEVVEVDGEVASILTHSRFAQDFTFQPLGGPCGVKPKVSVTASSVLNSWIWNCLCLISLSTRGQCVCGLKWVTHPERPTVLLCT